MKNSERTFPSVVKGVIFCLAMLLLMMLGGCGKMETMTVNTQLNINRNFDGERVMTMTMTSSVVDKLNLKMLIYPHCIQPEAIHLYLKAQRLTVERK